MKHRITRAAALACATLTLSACSSVNVNLWPFGRDEEQDPSRTPAGASAYQCEGGKRLFVRYLDNGAAAWVILPDREFRLNKIASASGTRYSNGSATLDVKDGAATLAEGAAVTHAGCKASGG
ncbi:MAG: MliC family protein [Betaproteobacteria bacterium]|nr:MliC family protein [Betaproteobacteria bacterium]